MSKNPIQRGAALLAAMLTVTLVATLAAAALWQQWRGVEIETAERSRIQSAWILTGALDLARLFLRQDGRSGNGPKGTADLLSTPLAETPLSTFLSQDASDDGEEAYMSGQIVDAQSRINIMSLVNVQKLSPAAHAAFVKLFALVGVPLEQLDLLEQNLLLALAPPGATDTLAPLVPQRLEELTWLGLSAPSQQLLKPYVTVLPTATTVNLNSASAEVIYAVFPQLDLSSAQRLVQQRQLKHFATLSEVVPFVGALPEANASTGPALYDVTTTYFEVQGRLRLDQTVLEEKSLVQRPIGGDPNTLWRQRWVSESVAASAGP